MQPLTKPVEELVKAEGYIEKMKVAQTLEAYEEHWKEFLHCLERLWNKTINHLNRSPKFQGWAERGKTENLRRKDPLLSYLVNARGADEHTIADITQKEPGGIGINPAEGNSLLIHKLEVNNGRISIEADRPVRIDFIPGKVKLLAVTNRGKVYQPPSQHLSQPINSEQPIDIARLGIKFYRDFIEKAERHFVK